jgi:hypothetical protein
MLQKSYSLMASFLFLSVLVSPLSLTSFAFSGDNLLASKERSFKVGVVKRSYQQGSVCVVRLPKTEKIMLLIPFPEKNNPVIGWVNINGQDIRIKQVMNKKKSKDRYISIYKSRNIVIVIESETTKSADYSVAVPVSETSDKVSITYQGTTRVINTTGFCAS